jgi:hypothetical protein
VGFPFLIAYVGVLSASLLDDFYEENEQQGRVQPTSHINSQVSSPSRGGFLPSFSFLRDSFANGSSSAGHCNKSYQLPVHEKVRCSNCHDLQPYPPHLAVKALDRKYHLVSSSHQLIKRSNHVHLRSLRLPSLLQV